MKKIGIIVVSIFIVLFVMSLAKDMVIKVVVEKGVEVVTGLKLSIRSFHLGVFSGTVHIKGLVLHNPAGFKDPVMIDMPEIYVSCDMPAIMSGKAYFNTIRLNLKEFMVVKNKNGVLNLDSLNVVKSQKEGVKPQGKAAKAMPMHIGELDLKIGKAVYKDYSGRGAEPSIKEFNVNINEQYRDINDPYALVSLIVVRALANTTIANLANFDLGGLKGTIGDTLGSVTKITSQAVGKAQQTLATTTGQAQQVAAGAGETMKKTAETLEGMLASPFGGSENK